MYIQSQNFGFGSQLKSTYHSGVYEAPLRIHQFPEIIFVLDGSVEITVDKTCETANAGDLAVITPFRPHAIHTPASCKLWIGRFSGDFISDFISEENLYLRTERAVFHPCASLAEYVRSTLPEPCDDFIRLDFDPIRYRRVKALVYTVFEEYTRTVPYTVSHTQNSALSSVLLYVSEHCLENISLASVSAALGYHPEYLSHCISVIPGMSFRTLLNSLRIDHAKRLLSTTDMRIIDVALESGFSCERSFHRAFCELTGITPGAYRRKKRKNA